MWLRSARWTYDGRMDGWTDGEDPRGAAHARRKAKDDWTQQTNRQKHWNANEVCRSVQTPIQMKCHEAMCPRRSSLFHILGRPTLPPSLSPPVRVMTVTSRRGIWNNFWFRQPQEPQPSRNRATRGKSRGTPRRETVPPRRRGTSTTRTCLNKGQGGDLFHAHLNLVQFEAPCWLRAPFGRRQKRERVEALPCLSVFLFRAMRKMDLDILACARWKIKGVVAGVALREIFVRPA